MLESEYIKGTCDTMCPLDEVTLRIKHNLVHLYEKSNSSKYFVKEFSRSAADKRSAKPSDIRTFEALQMTLDYLFNKILFDQQRPFSFRYDFIFDRCRAVRQEIVMQNISCEKTLKLLEPIVMFLSLSLYRLSGSPISVFDPKICQQHLQECLLKCLTCYDSLKEMEQSEEFLKSRAIIEGMHVLLNMDESSALQRAIHLSSVMKSSPVVQTSIKTSLHYQMKDFYKLLQTIRELPHLLSAVACLKLPLVRKEVIRIFSIAYNSTSLKVPIEFLQRLLLYDEKKSLIRDLSDLGLLDASEENPISVIFNRKKYESNKSISHTSQQFVDQKLQDFHLPDLILMKTL